MSTAVDCFLPSALALPYTQTAAVIVTGSHTAAVDRIWYFQGISYLLVTVPVGWLCALHRKKKAGGNILE